MDDQKKSSKFGLGLLFGTIIGAISALFLSPTTGEENRELVAKKIKQLEKLLEEKEIDKRVKEIFGTVTADVRSFYLKTKKELIGRLAALKEKVEEIDKEKYTRLVNDVVKQLSKDMKKDAVYTEKAIEKLKAQLDADWKKLTSKK